MQAFVACWKRPVPQQEAGPAPVWHSYYEPKNKAFLYLNISGGKLTAVVCTHVVEIDTDCSFKLIHECTDEQCERLQALLSDYGIEPRGTAEKPDTAGYADMSDYIPFVMSSDELHDLWCRLGLESEDD